MQFVVFGLTITSSWGNGHATLWRALCRALVRRGHNVVFFERDVPYYAAARDLHGMPGVEPVLYADWADIRQRAAQAVAAADVAMVTSYCPDGVAASDLVLGAAAPARVFYDLDTPVTLDRLAAGDRPGYLPPQGLGGFDLVLSYTGGEALARLRPRLARGAWCRSMAAWTRTRIGRSRPWRSTGPTSPISGPMRRTGNGRWNGSSWRRRGGCPNAASSSAARFTRRISLGGNIFFLRHMPPPQHPAFFSSSRLTLNITRQAMAAMGWCPSGRLFEAAACGAPILTDWWEGPR